MSVTYIRAAFLLLSAGLFAACERIGSAPQTQGDTSGASVAATGGSSRPLLRSTPDITAFLEAYSRETNQAKIERDYADQTIEITGRVTRLARGRDDDSTMYVVVQPRSPVTANLLRISEPLPVLFHFGCPDSTPGLADLDSGAVVTMRGRFTQLVKAQGEFTYRAVLDHSEFR